MNKQQTKQTLTHKLKKLAKTITFILLLPIIIPIIIIGYILTKL